MPIAFKSEKVLIDRTEGTFTSNEEVSFRRDVLAAEVALKAFKLDFVEGARPSDIVQVGVSLQSVGEETVEYQVRCNYSGAKYTGEVTVLIIADLR
jgi:hypothetical protein